MATQVRHGCLRHEARPCWMKASRVKSHQWFQKSHQMGQASLFESITRSIKWVRVVPDRTGFWIENEKFFEDD